EVASAKLFGFNSVSILLPSALAGALSVLLLYHLVRRHFGVVAGLLAALALAVSPISVVTNRNITIDSALTLTILVGAWAVMHAAETGKLRWLLLTAVIIGIGFNIKMLQAYLVVPAYGLLYLLAAPKSIWKRIGHLAVAGALLLVISLSWVVAVDLTPASQRPYVGSTQNNSEISLAFGYNGIQRLLGRFGGGSGGNTPTNVTPPSGNTGGTGIPPTFGNGGPPNPGSNGAGQQPRSGGTGGVGGLFDIGTAGPWRLFIQPLAGQIVWLLPLAILGAIALAWQRRPRFQSDRKQQSLVLWGTWLLTMGIFFSVAGFFHQYYMTVMAPAIAALFGIGLVTMWQDYRRGGWRGWLLPIALVVTIAEQIYILTSYPTWGQVLIPILVVVGIITVGALVSARIAALLKVKALNIRLLLVAISLGALTLMITSTVWAAIPVLTSTSADTLVAGPTQTDSFGSSSFGGGRDANANSDSALIRYLEAHQGTAKYLVAVTSSNEADSIILATNKPVMTLGGFSGSDPILTTSQLAALVKSGTVRFFLINGSGGGGPGGSSQSALTTWITQHCKLVSSSQYQSTSTNSSSGGFGGTAQLYEYASAS
ncbi:MAG TPA: glycosyltransferase family 39 protein, partial [Ktedonobacteraceae bacterium]